MALSELTANGSSIGLQVLDTIQTSFPRSLTPHLKELLSAALNHLSVLYPTFAHYYLQSNAAVPRSSEDETIELTHLVCPMLDFIASVARSGKAKDWFEGDNLAGLISAVFSWVQMSQDDVSGCYFALWSFLIVRSRKKSGRTMQMHLWLKNPMIRCRTVLGWLASISSL